MEGTVPWEEIFGNDIALDSEGNAYISGQFSGVGYFGPYEMNSADGGEGIILKVDPSGNLQWVTNFQGSGTAIDVRGSNVIVTGTVSPGTTFGQYSSGYGGMIALFDPMGNNKWCHIIATYEPGDIHFYIDDQIFFTGNILNNTTISGVNVDLHGVRDLLIGSISLNGRLNWVSRMGEVYMSPQLSEFAVDEFDNIYLTNEFESSQPAKFGCDLITGNGIVGYLAKLVPFSIATIDGPDVVCKGTTATYSYVPDASLANYQWDFSEVGELQYQQVDATTVELTFDNSDEVVLKLLQSANPGCVTFNQSSKVVKVAEPLASNLPITGTREICEGEQGTYSIAAPGDDVSVAWTVPPAATIIGSSELSVMLKFNSVFDHGVLSATMTNTCNSVNSSLGLSLQKRPGDALAIVGNDAVCAGEKDLIFTVNAIVNADEYVWEMPRGVTSSDGATITTSNQIHLDFSAPEPSVHLEVYGRNRCGNGMPTRTAIAIRQKPSLAEKIEGTTEVCDGSEVSFTTTENDEFDYYQWSIRCGAALETRTTADNSISAVFNLSGNITVAGINECGIGEAAPHLSVNVVTLDDFTSPEIQRNCNSLTYSAPQPMTWYKDGEIISAERSISLSGTGIYELRYATPCGDLVDIFEVSDDEIQVFIPNVFTPNNDRHNETFTLSSLLWGSRLAIYNKWGSAVFFDEHYENTWRGGGLSTGVYFYSIQSACGEHYSGTLTILGEN